MRLSADFPREEWIPTEEHEGGLGLARRQAASAEAVGKQHGGERGEQHLELEGRERPHQRLDRSHRRRRPRGERSIQHRSLPPPRRHESDPGIVFAELRRNHPVRVVADVHEARVRDVGEHIAGSERKGRRGEELDGDRSRQQVGLARPFLSPKRFQVEMTRQGREAPEEQEGPDLVRQREMPVVEPDRAGHPVARPGNRRRGQKAEGDE